MTYRYYLMSAVLVLVLTFAISAWRGQRSRKEIFITFCQVFGTLALLVAGIIGLAKLLETLGIAQSGFIL